MNYRPIERHGLIGDLHTAALIDETGAVTWFCAPHFDSPSLFAALLDHARGGLWRIAPVGGGEGRQRYREDTNILETRFTLPDGGTLVVTDFMPIDTARGPFPEIHRVVRSESASVDVAIEFSPRFNYATADAKWQRRGAGWLAADHDDDVASIVGPDAVAWSVHTDGLHGRLLLSADEEAHFVLRFDDDEVHPLADYATADKLDATSTWWRTWAQHATYHGPYERAVRRSLLALKLCCFAPTGATVAAPTTSLPEVPGGTRNWDYRFTWLRDSAFILFALDRSGYTDEGDAFTRFVKRLCRRGDGPHVQTMYRIDGGREMPERELDHLEGYGGAAPVRVGNGAAHQYQLDVYGEVLELLYARHRRSPPTDGLWHALCLLVEWTAAHWRDPDWSIWEAREEPRHFVFSKIMSWTALDRGARMAESRGERALADRWRSEADLVRMEVFALGWDATQGALVQAYGSPELDAAVLVAAKVGFLDRQDPRYRSTVAAIRRELTAVHDDLIYRYRRPDGLPGTEGAFVICSFWLVQGVALSGDLDEAERLFAQLLARGSPLGLFGEEIDPVTGAHLGNFPQAFSHAALINTAHIIAQLRRAGGAASGT
ncbi:MAG: glycoside hydrolase family 15 protein [Gemmatimonadaceae bacterium]|nr:glycoside hydrolase family 15 protein [Gemmatimonadaceae bacterium]